MSLWGPGGKTDSSEQLEGGILGFTLFSELCIVHSGEFSVQCQVYDVQCKVNNVQCLVGNMLGAKGREMRSTIGN